MGKRKVNEKIGESYLLNYLGLLQKEPVKNKRAP